MVQQQPWPQTSRAPHHIPVARAREVIVAAGDAFSIQKPDRIAAHYPIARVACQGIVSNFYWDCIGDSVKNVPGMRPPRAARWPWPCGGCCC